MAERNPSVVKGGHPKPPTPEEEMLKRLEQVVDYYVLTTHKSKSQAFGLAIEELSKRKLYFEQAN